MGRRPAERRETLAAFTGNVRLPPRSAISPHEPAEYQTPGAGSPSRIKPSFASIRAGAINRLILLSGEMERLHLSCPKLIRLNPLLRRDGYTPKACGA